MKATVFYLKEGFEQGLYLAVNKTNMRFFRTFVAYFLKINN